METVAHPPADSDLHLLTEWGQPDDRTRRSKAGVFSIAAHVGLIVILASLPRSVLEAPRHMMHHLTPLIAPPSEPTQIEPNKGKISKEFNAQELRPRPRIQIPPSPPSTSRPAAPQQAAVPAAVPAPTPAPPVPPAPEPPKIEALPAAVQTAQVIPPPQIQVQETKPKLAFENPHAPPPVQGAGIGRVAAPNASISEAMRAAVRGGAGGGTTVGDLGTGIGGIGEGVDLPPTPGSQGSNLELLSDPMGVDFRPYLIQILAAVRRNWWAVMPEAARLGRGGKVGIQFSIARNGSVPKLVIVANSGTDALDRAAVAGISASNPFPPLPPEFKGDQIRLQFNFAYNQRPGR